MNAKEDHWPSLPPIRTSSYNSRVSCETLTRHPSPPPASSSHAHTSHNTPSSSVLHRRKYASKSADASPLTNPSSPSGHAFSHCFPQKPTKGHIHLDGGRRGGAHTFRTTGLLRSIFGFSSPMVSFSDRSSPSNWQTPPSVLSSPSGRVKPSGIGSPISSAIRSGSATPLKSSKGHAAHLQAFTMMPPDVVGKKKPPGYESDEPKSPEVTCIGKVRRKHCKATWDALVKEKHKGKKKKEKIKIFSGDLPYDPNYYACGSKCQGGSESTIAAKAARPRSERRRSDEFERTTGMNSDADMANQGDLTQETLSRGMDGAYNLRTAENARNGDHAHMHSVHGNLLSSSEPPQLLISSSEQKLSSLQGDQFAATEADEDVVADSEKPSVPPSLSSESPCPPPDCLLLMRRGSRSRSAHYHQLLEEPGHADTQLSKGQLLT